MAKLRLVFAKEGRAVYISHLDLLRTFQRVFIREGLVLRHSQGFHPHPMISFALPLSVGQSSVCEILDFETVENLSNMDCAGLPEKLNAFMPEGIRALQCRAPVRPVRDLAVLRCKVEFFYDKGVPDGAKEEIAALLSGESLVIQKRTKRKELADINIRPMILNLRSIDVQPEILTLEADVSAQNPGLNPALLGTAVERHLPRYAPDFVRVRRLEVLDRNGNLFR